jgi:hypothetical protein
VAIHAGDVPDYAIVVNNSPLTTFAGQSSAAFSGALTAYLSYNSAVTLSCTAGSTGFPATCVPPNPVTPLASGTPFSVVVGGTVGDYSFNIHGVGADSFHIAHDAAIVLHVVDFGLGAPSASGVSSAQGNTSNAVTLVVSASGAFSGTVNLSCGGLISGAACSFSPLANVTPTAGSPVSVSLTVSVPQNATVGRSSFTVSATTVGAPSAKTQSVGLTVTAFSFAIADDSGAQTVSAGQAATYSIALTPMTGIPFPSAVQLSCASADLPFGAACSFTPSQVSAGQSGVQTVSLKITTLGPGLAGQTRIASRTCSAMAVVFWVGIAGFAFGGSVYRPRRKKISLYVLTAVMFAACLLILASCGGSSPSGVGGGGNTVAISVSPTSASLFPSQTQQFTSTVIGSTNTGATWTVSGGGSVSSAGLFTAPASITSSGTATVTATSQADSTKSQTATVTLNPQTLSGTYLIHINAVSGSVTETTTAGLTVQ